MGIGALLSRETARMRESLASAALGHDHSLLLARKRSTDWSFLAAAVTAGMGAGVTDPQQLLASFIDCDAGTAGHHELQDAQHALPPWPVRDLRHTPIVADVITCLADGAGADFPCAIRWRVVADAQGLTARALWHEPMAALRGFDAPLVPDRTTIRLGTHGTDVECWGFGRHSDPWPESPAPLDQLGDTYDLADAARHWWWAGRAKPARPATRCGAAVIDLPECDVVRVSPWLVSSTQQVHGDGHGTGASDEAEMTVRGSIAVPLRPNPSHLHVLITSQGDDRPDTMSVTWMEEGRCRGALRWIRRSISGNAAHRAHGGDSEDPRRSAPTHGWLDAQARLQLLQHVPTPPVLPEPYSRSLILGDAVDESAAHARATANIWHAAVTGDCAALAEALADGESLRRRRGLPRSTDAMALALLAESLLAHGAPDRSIALIVARHLVIASALPTDRAASIAESADRDLMPALSRPDYAAMLAQQGRTWASAHCTLPDVLPSHDAAIDFESAHSPTDPLVARFEQWQSSRQSALAGGSGAPSAIHALTLAISAAADRSPSGGIARSSSTGSVSTVRSELPSGSPGFTIVLPFLTWPTSVWGSSSRMPAFDLPRPWQSKQRASKNGSSSVYATAMRVSGGASPGTVTPAGEGAPDSAASLADSGSAADDPSALTAGAAAVPCDTRIAVHKARVT